ncbi:MAG: histidine-type phosphatase, partial [Anaerolineaceae bacterium]|nr:histidine-type phosphatase [Anaerolineaceae bacterium]
MLRGIIAKISFLFVLAAALLLETGFIAAEDAVRYPLSRENYQLEQVVILSRHNIRSPLSGEGSILGDITPHKWFTWSSAPSELSLRGGVLETEMGQFFRKWLEADGLIPDNYRPEGNEVRIYANSKQRTIATAQYFISGFLPAANLPVEYHAEFDTMDPVFTPQLIFVSDPYKEYAEAEIRAMFTDRINLLADNYELLADVIGLKDSEAFRNETFTEFRTDDTEFFFDLLAEPGMTGSLKTGCSVADALVLQYYEEPDELKAAFGHELSFEQWKEISEIKDLYVDVLYTSPLTAFVEAHPLLQEIRSEMSTEGRIFSFLCGHDSNVTSVMAALDVEEFILPDAIESRTPIGCKLVFTKWSSPDGKFYWGVDLVYQTPEQMRTMPLLTLE